MIPAAGCAVRDCFSLPVCIVPWSQQLASPYCLLFHKTMLQIGFCFVSRDVSFGLHFPSALLILKPVTVPLIRRISLEH